MMSPVCSRLLNMINDFVFLRFGGRAPEDLSAIEVIYIIIITSISLIISDKLFDQFHYALTLIISPPSLQEFTILVSVVLSA